MSQTAYNGRRDGHRCEKDYRANQTRPCQRHRILLLSLYQTTMCRIYHLHLIRFLGLYETLPASPIAFYSAGVSINALQILPLLKLGIHLIRPGVKHRGPGKLSMPERSHPLPDKIKIYYKVRWKWWCKVGRRAVILD